MRGVSVSYLFKDFLRLEDVGEYLKQYGYSYDAEIEEDYYKLKNTILDLYHENKLNIVFYYDDFAVIKTLRFSKKLSVEEIKEERFEYYISGYFHAPEVKSVIENECYFSIIKSTYGYYHLYDKEKLPIHDNEYKVEAGRKFTSIEFGDNLAPSIIEFSDLRFPKADLDKLFNEKNGELKSIKDELVVANDKIADLENQVAQAKAELGDKPVSNQNKEKQGDSLLILGAVMHCIKDAAKKNFTQELLTQTILDRYKNVQGISESTLKKKYSESKEYIKQRDTQ